MTVEELKESVEMRKLFDEGKRKGILTYDEINDAIGHREDLDPEQMEDLLQTFAAEGIQVVDKIKDPEIEEEPASGAVVRDIDVHDQEISALEGLPIDDSVRMWLREIGKTPLLSSEEEIYLARIIAESD
ncbi:MAG: RNA polymerase sigma factor region1.1 domain-containing protein, partial [Armatimonadota bacterium]